MKAEAKGYITKNSTPEILVATIQKFSSCAIYIKDGLVPPPNYATNYQDMQSIIANLTAREFDVFLLIAKALTAHKIAEKLSLNYKTVANYGTQIRSKLKVSSVVELAQIAVVLGVVKN